MNWIENNLDISYYQANEFMRVAKELPNIDTWQNLGSRALYLISTLPEEEREKEHTLETGTVKQVDEMTVINYARQLEKIERMKAKERQEMGVSQNSDGGRSDDIVSDKLGIGSRDTYRKEKYIADNADDETLKQRDKRHQAYQRLQAL